MISYIVDGVLCLSPFLSNLAKTMVNQKRFREKECCSPDIDLFSKRMFTSEFSVEGLSSLWVNELDNP